MTDEFSEIRFKKSPLKLIMSLIVYGICFVTFFAMGFSSEVALPWIAWIVAFGALLLIKRNIQNLFSKYEVIINNKGIKISDDCINWTNFSKIDVLMGQFSSIGWQEIWITTKEEKEKCTIFGKKMAPIRVIIPPYTLNASQEKITDELRRFSRKFGEPDWQ